MYDLLDSIDSEVEVDSESDEETVTGAPEKLQLSDHLTEDLQSSDGDENDDIPLAYLASGWKPGFFSSKEDPLEQINTNSVLTPWQYFQRYLGNDFFSLGSECTAQYHLQNTGKVLNVSPTDIKSFWFTCHHGMHPFSQNSYVLEQ